MLLPLLLRVLKLDLPFHTNAVHTKAVDGAARLICAVVVIVVCLAVTNVEGFSATGFCSRD